MTAALPPALRRALELLADPPAEPDVTRGYLDLLAAGSVGEGSASPNKTGAIQALWASPAAAMVYDNAQAVLRKLVSAFQPSVDWLDIPQGGIILDVGCGPASVTASIARAGGPDALVLGLDRSEAMLARAVRAQSGPQLGFLRADAQRLPLRGETVDAVVSIGVLQFMPDPAAALAEMMRVLRPGGQLAVVVPVARHAVRFWRRLPSLDPYVFTQDEVGDILKDHGFAGVQTKNVGPVQWVRGRRSGDSAKNRGAQGHTGRWP
ncbi:methyltransferase domain-containing protein [Mycobacterium sp. IS-1264]|uniref:class I SAM-dependent methyltransferase n=1 Tax=Mycobacterium sp. IS-1264 TaxID=1834158 RepID=UPI00096E68A1|nr:methyltransferase domain-containing protein [Mycobacterium sp. IS-1264]OMC39127.1 SAM-dependent methyltransferase [Mycobacterium sp. IS-1264]